MLATLTWRFRASRAPPGGVEARPNDNDPGDTRCNAGTGALQGTTSQTSRWLEDRGAGARKCRQSKSTAAFNCLTGAVAIPFERAGCSPRDTTPCLRATSGLLAPRCSNSHGSVLASGGWSLSGLPSMRCLSLYDGTVPDHPKRALVRCPQRIRRARRWLLIRGVGGQPGHGRSAPAPPAPRVRLPWHPPLRRRGERLIVERASLVRDAPTFRRHTALVRPEMRKNVCRPEKTLSYRERPWSRRR